MNITDLTVDELEKNFTPLAVVPDNAAYIERGAELSAKVRQNVTCSLDVFYGDSQLQNLDIFYCGNKCAPIVVFIHGGYWYSLDKSDYSYVAGPLTANGADVVLVNYDLCPSVSLDVVVAQCMKAIAWVYRNIASAGNKRQLFVSGNSAGAHLAAMALAKDWSLDQLPSDVISGAFLVTGIYDVRPVPRIKANNLIGLSEDVAIRNSPMFMDPKCRVPVLIAVGEKEPRAWIQQSTDYSDQLRNHDVPVNLIILPNENHFSIAESLGDPCSLLTRSILPYLERGQGVSRTTNNA